MGKPKTIKGKGGLATADAVVSLGQWAWERVKPYIVPLFGGGVMAGVTAATEWLNDWGPIAWGSVGLLTFMSLTWLHGWWILRVARAASVKAQTAIIDRMEDDAAVNPLSSHFADRRIHLHDLRTPLGDPLADRTFQNCELLGPATVVLGGGMFGDNDLRNVDFVKISGDHIRQIPNKLILHNCVVRHCRLYNVILLVPEQMVAQIEAGFDGELSWLN
jgi:hypothetical protein